MMLTDNNCSCFVMTNDSRVEAQHKLYQCGSTTIKGPVAEGMLHNVHYRAAGYEVFMWHIRVFQGNVKRFISFHSTPLCLYPNRR